MVVRVDRMTMEDVPEVMAIERDSFAGYAPWPGSAYKRELSENRNAHYLVLRQEDERQHPERADAGHGHERRGFWGQLFPLGRSRELTPAAPDRHLLAGYAGLWLMVDEAHITTIAVRSELRGRGLGELLLVSLAEIAFDINARWLTLEVRVSNSVAQALYRKYGFKPSGVRHRYYSDNQEDALIMWTDEIQTMEYQNRFSDLREDLHKRLIAAGDLVQDGSGRSAGARTE